MLGGKFDIVVCIALGVVYLPAAYGDACPLILSSFSENYQLTKVKQSKAILNTQYNSGSSTKLYVSCTLSAPNIAVTWDGPDPDVAFYDLVGAAGNLVTHRPAAEVVKFSKQCRQEALKDNTEIATIERKGMAIECQAFERDGGGTIITVFAE